MILTSGVGWGVRRADRLFSIIQLLRKRKVLTAGALAEKLEVSERTIYRDIRDLVLSGTPIDGEPGVGYALRSGYDLPPLMFDESEIEALVLGARIVKSYADVELARASGSALSKVESVLPKHLEKKLDETRLYSPNATGFEVSDRLLPVRLALAQRRKIELLYRRQDGAQSRRVVRPLGAFFWGPTWTLTAWCELRDDFRTFRVDRMEEIELLDATFEPEPGRTLEDYAARLGDEGQALLGD